MRLILAVLAAAGCSLGCSDTKLLGKNNDKAVAANGNQQPTEPPPEDATVPPPIGDTSYAPVDNEIEFEELRAKLVGEKPDVMARQKALLESRYDMSDRPEPGVVMFRGKAVQGGVRVRLPEGQTWESLGALTPAEIKSKGVFPAGFLPLPHIKQAEGGQVLPQFHIDAIAAAEARDLKRFDVDLDIPDHFLPEFPPPIFLTSRPDLGDTSRGELITIKNFFKIYNGVLTPKQINGLRLLVSPLAQQQFNLTSDRRVDEPTLGISCFDCHANGSTNGATHLDPVTRPQEARRRLDTPTLRGVNIQRLFGSQRALKTIEDFTQFEQLAAYFDGDPVIGMKKGLRPLDRNIEVPDMAEFQNLLDFPPAPKLAVDGKLDPALATDSELRGQELFFGKANCASCHTPPYYTDNQMHNLKTERFYKPNIVNGKYSAGDGSIKTFPLRGIKDTPPYLHDGRLLTLDDTVEYFNLVLSLKLNAQEKKDIVNFMLAL